MAFLGSLFILCAGYYSLTYGIYVLKTEKNTLGGFGVLLITIIGTVLPIIMLFIKS